MDASELRYELRRWLYGRPTAAHDAATISHGLARWGHEATAREVEVAATYLEGLDPPQVKVNRTALSPTKYFQITTAGIQDHEANA